jgi:hypothetical protein
MADKQGYRPRRTSLRSDHSHGRDRPGRGVRQLPFGAWPPGAGDQRAGDTASGPGVDLETLPDEELTVLTMGELPRQLR